MGIGVAPNGDVWIADGSDNQLLYFPGGRIKEGKIVKPAGLLSPFDIVIDFQNRVWVANSSSDTVVRFPANDPSKAETFHCGIGVRALALDSKGNVWVANNMDLKMPLPKIPDGASIMEQFKLITEAMVKYIMGPPARITGQVNMIRPDGTQPVPEGFTGPAESIPWGINVDGNDDVWVGNMWGRSAALLAGDNTKGHPAGMKAGSLIHIFQSGTIQMVTDVSDRPGWQRLGREQLEQSRSRRWPESGSSHLDLGRRLGLYGYLWSGGPGEAAAHGQSADVLTQPPRQIHCRAAPRGEAAIIAAS